MYYLRFDLPFMVFSSVWMFTFPASVNGALSGNALS